MSGTDTPASRIARRAGGLVLALLCGCAGAGYRGAGSRGDLPRLYADPGVRVERPGRGVIAYRRGMAVHAGDVIQTAGGYAVIDFHRGSVVDLRPNTRIALGSITLFFGELFARIVDIATSGGGQVVTDELTASVEGTEYAVRRMVAPGHEHGGTGISAVIVRTGRVRCAPRAIGAWPEVSVAANLIFQVVNDRAVGPPTPIDAAAETRWADETEGRLLEPSTPGPSAALEREVLDLVNGHRIARRLLPLALDVRLSSEARRHSAAMAAGELPLGHEGLDDRMDALRRAMACRRSAEIVAFNQGYRSPASQAVRGWLASRGHRTNIEGPYDATGVGVASNAAGEIYFTQIFVGACTPTSS